MTAVAHVTEENINSTLIMPNRALRFSPPAVDAGSPTSTGVMGRLFRPPSNKPITTNTPRTADQRSIWVLEISTQREVQIAIGASEGTMPQILGGDVADGASAITDIEVPQ